MNGKIAKGSKRMVLGSKRPLFVYRGREGRIEPATEPFSNIGSTLQDYYEACEPSLETDKHNFRKSSVIFYSNLKRFFLYIFQHLTSPQEVYCFNYIILKLFCCARKIFYPC